MAFDFFKKKPTEKKEGAKKTSSARGKEEPKKKPALPTGVLEKQKEKPEKPVVEAPKAKKAERAAATHKAIVAGDALKSALITEKAVSLAEKNQYVFKVFPRTNKFEIKRAVQSLFGVDVTGVRIINVSRKSKRIGRVQGFRGEYKKAIVKVKDGQKIEVLPR